MENRLTCLIFASHSHWRVPGIWFDIGSKETLEEANQIFAKL
jgi:NDP-sugar pyrophosphorylase family protein